MKRKTFAEMDCSVAQTLEIVGDPWTLLIVRDAFFGITRFADFQRRLGTPRNTLTERLSLLNDHGILERHRYQDRPPRDEYRLTAKGRDLHGVIISLMLWGDRWAGLDDAPVEIIDETTGQPLDPVLVDRASGVPIAELPARPRRRDEIPE
ncbi:MAG: helix-turn-helix domain-containing protein [Actinomycetota bacterium]